MSTNMSTMFDTLFAGEEVCTIATGNNGNTIESARGKVIRCLQESKALFNNPKHTYMKHGKAQRPVPCFAPRSDGKYVIKVLFSRVTLDLPNGSNALVCSKERVNEVHDKLVQFVKSGQMDDKISQAQERYRQSQLRSTMGQTD